MTQETPAKVFSLLGVALSSLFFLFAVTVTNASFSQTEKPFPATFNPDRVMAFLDQTSNSYARFFHEDFVAPGVQSYAIMQDNVNYVIDEASPSILHYTGLSSLADVSNSVPTAMPQVAGASVSKALGGNYGQTGTFSVDTLYSFLIR
ncbi:MAG TPA: hypothetical protein VHA30_03860 [Patescibacteria group bacterium]|nr:hypothetical protein [Patescibacteria group bacterium]